MQACADMHEYPFPRRRKGYLEELRHQLSSSLAARGVASSSQDGAPNAAAAEGLASIVRESFLRDPKATSLAILSELSELDRVHLVIALQQTTDRSLLRRRDTQYIEELLKKDSQGASLSTVQVANAIEYQRMLHRYSSYEVSPPSAAQLAGVALASGLPFVAFGFVDNSVMITAGGEIEALVGVRWGLSTLASAALGNVVADVLGVSLTHQIQSRAKDVKWARPPRLSMLQQRMGSVKAASLGGAALGVSIGCLLGMLPLAFIDPPEPEKGAAERAADSAPS